MSFTLSSSSLKKLEGVDETMKKIVENAITITNQNFIVAQGFRTAEEQHNLYQIGRTKELTRGIVTNLDGYIKKSRHQTGLAVDLVPYENGKVIWDIRGKEYMWLEIGRAMLESARIEKSFIEWGLTYIIGKHYDVPHFQLIK